MTSSLGYMELCRLCLVKDKVTVPIFGDTNDVRQIFLKITACLPVKVSRDDNLPKKICDSCLYKIDLLYQFWNTTINAEKQLIQWLNEIGVDAKNVDASLQMLPQSHAHPHAMQEEIMMKEERIETETKDGGSGFPNLYTEFPYQNPENNFDTPPVVEETPPAKRKTRGRPAGKKKAKVIIPESDDEDSIGSDRLANDDTNDSDSDGGKIAKQEADSDEDYVDNPESLEPTTFVDVPSAADAEQPGPSGLSKPATITAGTSDQGNIFPFWDNNNEKPDGNLTIKLEPIDINWDDEDMTLMDLKNKMGLALKRKRPQPKPYRSQKNPCIICNNIIRGRSALINHYLIHKEEKIQENLELIKNNEDKDFHRCCICMKEFMDKGQLDKHSGFHFERPYFCEKCNRSFKQTQNFLTHMSAHKLTNELKCDQCDFKTTFKLAFDQHRKSHCRLDYKCDLCDKSFNSRNWYLEHKNFHSGQRPFSCEECGKCFPYTRYLTAHKKSMHPHCFYKEPQLNECQICKKRYSHKNSLRLHMKSHTGDNLYLCDICGKKLSSTDKLQLHKRIHTGYKPYSCTVCAKKFTKKDILTDHLRVHTGEKPFSCETCGKSFSQRSPLTIHKRYHTGERPYACHLCNKGFVSKGILSTHLKQGKH